MSWRQPGGGTGVQARRPNRPVYEDFQPQTDTNEEEGARVVVLHVPGFLKEQMKITAEQGTNIRVHGQRPLLDKRWSRFNVLLPVPQNCDAHKIHAKFHNGILTITMPKEVPGTTLLSPVAEKPANKTTRENIGDTLPPKAYEGKVVPPSVSEPNPKAAAAAAELRVQKDPEKAVQTAAKDERQKNERDTTTNVEKIPQKTDSEAQKGEKRSGEPKDAKKINQGRRDERVEKQREIGGETRLLDSAGPMKASSEKIQPKAQSDQEAISSGKSYADKKNAKEELKEPEKGGKLAEKTLEKGKESTPKGKESSDAPPAEVAAVSKILDDGKKAVEKLVSGAANEDGEATSGNKLGIKYIAETTKQTMTNVVKKLNEDDRQMLINIGAAVLVLIALGASVSFGIFGSSAENEN